MRTGSKNIKQKILHFFSGSILTEDFFVKNWRFILVVFFITALYISNRFSCISRVTEIEKLNVELKKEKSKSLTISSELIGIGRQSQVESLVRENNLGLQFSKEPITEIEE